MEMKGKTWANSCRYGGSRGRGGMTITPLHELKCDRPVKFAILEPGDFRIPCCDKPEHLIDVLKRAPRGSKLIQHNPKGN